MAEIFEQSSLSEGSLRDHFLIAMPGLQDPDFSQTITYICEHSDQGAMGLIVNHTMSMKLGEILLQMDINDDAGVGEQEVLTGGPVQLERGFVLHSTEKKWSSTYEVSDDIALTASRDVIESIGKGEGPEHHLVILGYAGWSAGQLEQEIADNAWLTIPASRNVLFDIPTEQRWHAAAKAVGIDLYLMSSAAGHA
ncbi:YqgE/AlgH family protein [Marinibactrum halimedae]|uniref:UPF0301 protein GCM10007877_27690 n=1 Tax=Marinibactrum halimedae TaxID=1444977 RepID=A0AA37WN79_9GAMM|nr:YqgE/AlgH family protein [Marinibactrum halimedae]MCD9458322.1 YqgE/AlgH family protein [Marinibactrum halimedae]GLS27050.1 UPF0301 protein [Marinibactrum halimedae]